LPASIAGLSARAASRRSLNRFQSSLESSVTVISVAMSELCREVN
jgi:hypothetical protein